VSADGPISPPPVRRYRPDFLPAYLCNGVVALRAGRVALVDGLATLNGFAGLDADTGVESLARVPYPLAADLRIGGTRLSQAPELARFREQRYDFATGELHTSFTYRTPEATAEAEVLTFYSRSQPTVVLQEVRVTVDRACDVALTAAVDHSGVPGRSVNRDTATRGFTGEAAEGALVWESYGGVARCGLAYCSELLGADAEPVQDENATRPLSTTYAFRARSGRTYRLRQLASVVVDTMHRHPDRQALRLLFAAQQRGFDRLRDENRRAWDELWGGRVQLVGAPRRWQAIADAAHFYLHTSVHPSSPNSTSLFGLAYWPTYHYYRGHIMWDLETLAFPPLLLTQPESARAMLDYRADRLAAARRNAKMSGYRGVQFPWESSIRLGEEAAPGEGAASANEHHVSLDVAVAFAQFLHASHDWEWGKAHAWPVLHGVCEWIESRVVETGRGFEIHGVNGIAEREQTVDNNAFVNMAAIRVLRETIDLAGPLGHEPRPAWQRIADRLVVPLDPRTKVIRSHDGYRANEEKGETPEAAAGLFPLGYEAGAGVEEATLRFALGLADRYVGSPMLSSMLGVYAARVGDRARSLELFERGYADFILAPFAMTDEYSPGVFPDMPRAGPFTANLGGFLTACLYGLTGLRLHAAPPEQWCGRPVVLPRGWDAIEVERITVRGVPARLSARHGDKAARIQTL
jgi:trehalose/maltose hydrolase-like predicted phosphorylase